MRLFNELKKLNKAFFINRSFLTSVLAVVLSLSIGVASAFFVFNGNNLGTDMRMSSFEGVVNSDKITNNTDRDVYVRAYLVPYWQSASGNSEEFIGLPEWNIDDKINNGGIIINDSDWKKSGNYYYYKNKLTPGKPTTELVTKFTTSMYYDNSRNSFFNAKLNLANDYENNTTNESYIYPHLSFFEQASRLDSSIELQHHVNYFMDTVSESFDGGSGTKADPFLISDGHQLLKCVTSTGVAENGAKLYYKLANDIYLNDMLSTNEFDKYNQWIRSRDIKHRFCGEFDGDGHIVSGLHVKASDNSNRYVTKNDTVNSIDDGNSNDVEFAGLFPCLGPGAVVKNLGIMDSYFSNVPYAGAIAGVVAVRSNTDEPVVIKNCFVQSVKERLTDHTEKDGDANGALVGYAYMPELSRGGDNKLLQIEDTYFYGDFDIWNTTVTPNTSCGDSTNSKKYRSSTVGNSNNLNHISVTRGYCYLVNEYNNGTTLKDDSAEDDFLVAPKARTTTVNGTSYDEKVTVTDYFSHKQTSHLAAEFSTGKTNYQAMQEKLTSEDFVLGELWSFEKIDTLIYPTNGIYVSKIISEGDTTSTGSGTLAKQAYKIAFELLQADGKKGEASVLSDTWGSHVESLILSTNTDYLKSNYTFLPAQTHAIMNDLGTSSTSKWREAGESEKQPTISTLNLPKEQQYIRYETQNHGGSDRPQSYADLTSAGVHLDKNNTPYMAFIVAAPNAGSFAIAPEFIAKNASRNGEVSFCVLSVNDDEYQRCNFASTVAWNASDNIYFSANPTYVNFKAGINVIRIIMPREIVGTYDWFNLNGLWIYNTLSGHEPINPVAQNKSEHSDSKTFADDNFIDFRGGSADTSPFYVASNKYGNGNEEDCINVGQADNAGRNLITFENSKATNYEYLPYSIFKVVNNGAAGYYDMELTYNTKSLANVASDLTPGYTSGYMVARVNGINYRRYFKAYANGSGGTGKSMLNTSIYLEKGENIITFTAPLDSTDSDATLNYMSWFNQYGVTIHGYKIDGVSSLSWTQDMSLVPGTGNDADKTDISAPHKYVLEAEDYASYNLYSQIETTGGATVIGGMLPWYAALPRWANMSTDNYVKRNTAPASNDTPYFLDDNSTPHVDFQIYSPSEGTYKIKPRFYFAFFENNYDTGAPDGKYYIMMVNDEFIRIEYDKGDFDIRNGQFWYNEIINVNLKEGVNVVRFILVDRNTYIGGYAEGYTSNSSAPDSEKFVNKQGIKWANFDYVELLDDKLVGVMPSVQFLGAVKSHEQFSYNGANPENYNSGNGTYDDLANPFERNKLTHMNDGGYTLGIDYINDLTLSGISIETTYSSPTGTLPAVSYTVNVPTSGYYDLSLSYATKYALTFALDKNITTDDLYQYAVFVNGGIGSDRYILPLIPSTRMSDARTDCSVYFKAGVNVITITPPIDTTYVSRIKSSTDDEWFDIGALRISGGMNFVSKNYGIDPHTFH